jgi:hypothetical protein
VKNKGAFWIKLRGTQTVTNTNQFEFPAENEKSHGKGKL